MFFFFSSRRRHTRSKRDWSSDVCSSDLTEEEITEDFTLDLPDGSVLTKVETKTVKVNYMGDRKSVGRERV